MDEEIHHEWFTNLKYYDVHNYDTYGTNEWSDTVNYASDSTPHPSGMSLGILVLVLWFIIQVDIGLTSPTLVSLAISVLFATEPFFSNIIFS